MPGVSTAGAGVALTALKAAYAYAQLHTDDPGADGTENVANETTRVLTAWPATPVTTATMSNTNALTWEDVQVNSGTQTYTHVSFWSAATAGTFGMSGSVTANPVSDGDTFQIAIGGVTVTQPVAS